MNQMIKVTSRRRIGIFLAVLLIATVAPQILNIKAAFAGDGYPWDDAQSLASPNTNYDFGYSTCPSSDPNCMKFKYTKTDGSVWGEADPWVYYLRNCTSYVAYKIQQQFNVSVSGWGYAYQWDGSATGTGHPYTNDSTPQVGDIAQWGSNYAHGWGHVAYVWKVDSNNVAYFYDYNEAGTGLFLNTSTSTNNILGHAPDNYIHIGTLSTTTTPANYAMLLDAGGAVWAQQGVSANWTLETPANALEKAIAAGGGIQMLMDGGGAVWAQQGQTTSWTLETPANAGEKAIAAGGGTQMLLDGAGQVWARSGIGTAWTQETPPGEVAIAAGANGLQMLLDSGGTVWAKSSIGNGGWTQETPTNSGGKAIAAGDIQMLLDSGGQVWAQPASSFTTSWTPETSANAGEKAIAAGNGVQMLIDAGGAVWARTTSSLGTTWTLETPANAGEVAITAGASNLQMLLDAGGAVWAQNGSTLSTSWTSETPANAGEKAIAAGS